MRQTSPPGLPVIDFPDLPALSAALTDRALCRGARGIAALSGFVRGFSGFGSALIYVPLISRALRADDRARRPSC